MKNDIVKSKVKCPKCKGTNLYLIEIWTNHSIEWEQENGIFNRNDGNMEMGNPDYLEAKCMPCNHQWKVRGCGQIDDVIID